MATLQTGQVTVGTSATLVATIVSPNVDGVLINSSVAAFVGGPGVTTATGFPVGINTPVVFPCTAANPPQTIYAVVGSGSATVSFAYPG